MDGQADHQQTGSVEEVRTRKLPKPHLGTMTPAVPGAWLLSRSGDDCQSQNAKRDGGQGGDCGRLGVRFDRCPIRTGRLVSLLIRQLPDEGAGKSADGLVEFDHVARALQAKGGETRLAGFGVLNQGVFVELVGARFNLGGDLHRFVGRHPGDHGI